MSLQIAGKIRGPESTSTYVVYDGKTGRVVHVHHVLVLPGANPMSQGQIEALATSMAARRENLAELRILHVPGEGVDAETEYRVDVLTQQLIATKLARSD